MRSNGQQETFLLRKEDIPKAVGPEKWKYVVKKVDDSTYEIDPTEFALKINTLGELIEDLSLATAYQKGQPIGIKVGKVGKDEIGSAIGLNGNDIILSVNNVITSDMKNRVKIYDTLSQTKKGDIIKIVLKRKNQDITLSYKLTKLEKPKKKAFIEPVKTGQTDQSQGPGQFKLSREQEKEKRIKEFEKIHRTPKQQEVIRQIRERMLENMKKRARNRRVR